MDICETSMDINFHRSAPEKDWISNRAKLKRGWGKSVTRIGDLRNLVTLLLSLRSERKLGESNAEKSNERDFLNYEIFDYFYNDDNEEEDEEVEVWTDNKWMCSPIFIWVINS